MERLSVIIITKNEEKNIERCLKSVQWVDEIVVVDAFSTDATLEICTKYKVSVQQREWEGFARQKSAAVSFARNQWVLSLDADEEVPEDLKNEIQKILSGRIDADGFQVARRSFFLGRWMKYGGWYPAYQLRLFDKNKVSMNVRPVHEGFEVTGRTARLHSPLNHYTYHSIHQYLEKMNDYTSLEVSDKLETSREKTVRWYDCVLHPLSLFGRMYCSRRGFMDGFHGFVLAVFSSLYTLLVYAKSWEYQQAQRNGEALPPVTNKDILALKRYQSL
jgi:glycosyltransferase involved in cell wall biosynthesis